MRKVHEMRGSAGVGPLALNRRVFWLELRPRIKPSSGPWPTRWTEVLLAKNTFSSVKGFVSKPQLSTTVLPSTQYGMETSAWNQWPSLDPASA